MKLHNHYILVAFFAGIILFGYAETIKAQHVKSNEIIFINEIKLALVSNELLVGLDRSFSLDTNFPYRITVDLNRYLFDNGFQIRTNNEPPAIQVRFFTNNSLIQTGRNEVNRILSGELNLFLIGEDAEILQSSSVSIKFTDFLTPGDVHSLESDWIATRFAEKQLNERSRWRSIGQPAILAAATGVTVFLLFNVRS